MRARVPEGILVVEGRYWVVEGRHWVVEGRYWVGGGEVLGGWRGDIGWVEGRGTIVGRLS